jgi:hypothetical protein
MVGNVYVTIGLDKKGNVVEVRVDGRPIEPRQGPDGLLRDGGSAPGCEEVVQRLVHELLTCRKKGQPGSGTGTGSGGGSGSGTDPCCYRDPNSGRIWCWC